MSLGLIIVLLISPLVGFLINGLFGKWLKGNEKLSGTIGALAVFISLICSIIAFVAINIDPAATLEGEDGFVYRWISGGKFSVDIGFHVDALTTVMLLVITGVGFLIHVYSIGYMHGDEGYTRYFAYLNLFVFAMLILVLGNNYLMMFVGWEGVGLCSYLLIGFWYEKQSATDAGKKAFIVNRIGDFGFLLGMFTLFAVFNSLDFTSIFSEAEAKSDVVVFGVNGLVLATMLLFVGAIGKSAQLPLYVWLPDAMEGPTPVSALIHAATMVTAGVYMIARSAVLYNLAGTGTVVAWIGVLTALFAAIIALKQNDIKRILAYSTVSQLGYMFVGVGIGAYASGIFHLVTHAFFKGLMFLTAGSVMHAMANELDIRKMGGLRNKLPITHATFLVGALAIAGAPFLSGFWSKDEILHSAWGNYKIIYIIGLATAFLTAFYMFRLIFVTFYGKSRVEPEVASHIHESPAVMWLPLVILAVPAALIGLLLGIGGHHSWFHHFTENVTGFKGEAPEGSAIPFMIISSIVGILGIAYAWTRYKERAPSDEPVNALQKLVANKFYVDEIYNTFIVQPIKNASHFLLWKLFDVGIIDGIVNGAAALIRVIGGLFRRLQTGVVQAYILSMVIGIVLFLAYYLFFAN
ncbi:NADH-quinone oxidoreductase subunit L [Candidatus Poribacteria bacterium]|nr:NADH-quinone oxidoreductase subunit L [Candidatus Poribacteria bacterium]MYB63112.1 NADH-quinone oxidoreductase subunit L [Candidatus Poribacteria bacterium]MYF57050.1 NADH-quinone oxidoreductase subunit L [Candidatus Poribacteria bacterium]